MTFLCPIMRDAWMDVDDDADATCAIRANEDTARAVRLFFAAGV